MAEDDAHLTGTGKLGGGDEILLAQRQEFSAHHARKIGPGEQRDDHRDGEVDLRDRPGVGQRSRKPHPERYRRHRAYDLDQSLDDGVDDAAVDRRYAAEQHAEKQADRDADEPDGERHARRHKEARPQIAAEPVGAEQMQRFARLRVLQADEMDIRFEQSEQLVRIPANEHREVDLGGLIADHAECARIAAGAQHDDVRAQRPVVIEEADRLRWRIGAPGIGVVRIHGGEEIREGCEQVEQDDHDAAYAGELMAAEAPPGELKLARDRQPFFGGGRIVGGGS